MDNTIKLEQLKTTIEKLAKGHQLEMLKILNYLNVKVKK